MGSENFESEARAKLLWGESPKQVLEFLQSKNIGEKQALGLIATFQQERLAEIRSSGVKAIIVGFLLVAVSVVGFFLLNLIHGMVLYRSFGLPIVFGLAGLWKMGHGLFMILAPQFEKGDISKLED